ncbi:GFA family protein [Pseudomonas izuensis]|uniref:GFA family protein n=1 Tax=Pseudomonas izuensis TaxID=2684212 RepID=UPI000BBB58C8|nr:GFA family protein [Pseudomonas izuensis]
MTEKYQGSCLCAAVSYELLTPPKSVSHCHCSQCRKGHGAAFASYGSVPRKSLRILGGATSIKTYASSETVLREFCETCGSTLFWSRFQGEFTDWISIALGTLDTSFMPQKQKHIHVDSAAHWYTSPRLCPWDGLSILGRSLPVLSANCAG